MKYLTTNWLFFVLVSSGLNSLDFGQFDQVINVPPEELADQQMIPSNTQVNVFDGGIVGIGVFAGQFGVANENVEFNIFGGTIGSSFRAFDGTEVNIFGGEIGSFFEASAGSVVNIEGGELSSFSADGNVFDETGSIVNVSGGTFTANFSARIFSNVNISGGNFSRGLFVGANSFPDVLPPANVTVSGGVFGDTVFVGETGALTIAGGEFRLNGQDITGEKTLALGESDVLTLTLTGGNPMLLSPLDGDQFFSDLILVESDVPPIDNTEFFIDESSTIIPTGLRQGQSLELSGNGTLPENFTATQATLRIKDGEVGFNLDVIDGSLFLDGGELDSPTNVFGKSVVELNGGDTGFRLTVFDGANLNVNDGHANCLVGMDGSFISVSGGQGTLIEANAGCEVSVDGGIFGYRFESASRGEIFGGVLRFLTVRENSDVTLNGGEFLVNGKKPNSLSSVTLKPGDVLTGTLVDGTPFISSGIIGFGGNSNSSQQPRKLNC